MKITPSTIGFVVAGIIVLLGVYWYASSPREEKTLSTFSGPPPLESQFIALTNALEPIAFPTAIFENPRFMALVNITTNISQEAIGRPDPFAPL